MANHAICSVNDSVLAQAVDEARERLVFVAPGASLVLAEVLAKAWKRLGPDRMSVILDADAGACRLGYGEEAGLTLLHETAKQLGAMVCHQPDLRVGVVVSEQRTLVYSPPPLMIEAGSKPGSGANAISLSGEPPATLARDLGVGPNGVSEQAIGLDGLTQNRIDELTQDLKRNPPIPVNVSRLVTVFNSQLEFVEFTVAKIQIQRIEMSIPQSLTGLAGTSLRTLFRFQPGKDLMDAKEALEKSKREIDKEYTRPAKGFGGSLIERTRKDEFLGKVKQFEEDLNRFREFVRDRFDEVAAKNKEQLHEALLPAVVSKPPSEWLARVAAGEARAQALSCQLQSELDELFQQTGKDIVSSMHVSVRFKGVTHECLVDENFRKLATHAFPHLRALHEEYQAAPESGGDG